MKRFSALLLLTAFLLFFSPASNAAAKRHRPKGPATRSGPNAIDKDVNFAELDKELAQWRVVRTPLDPAGLGPVQRKMVAKLVDATHYLEDIFLRQSEPEAVGLMQSLEGSKDPQDQKVLRMLRIMGSRYDLLAENKSFIGTAPMSPDRGLYPAGVTREDIEQYVKTHPEKKQEIYSPYTIVRRQGDELVGIPYHIAYRSFLEPAAKDLREAAALSADAQFANFLRLRAD